MPIYEETYRPWHGHTVTQPRTAWVIGKTGIQLLWKRGLILFLLLSTLPFLVRAVQIYIMSRAGDITEALPAARAFQINAGFFLKFLQGQVFYLILVLIFTGAGLIANDRKFKALSIYFSKPVGFWDYIGGKFMTISAYGLMVTLVPGWLLFLTGVFLDQDASFLRDYYWVPLAMLAVVAVLLISLGGLVLALSAFSQSTRTAAILYFGVLTLPELLRAMLGRIPSLGLFSLQAVIKQIGAACFGQPLPYNFSVWLGALLLALLVGGCIAVLRWRVKPTEVVK